MGPVTHPEEPKIFQEAGAEYPHILRPKDALKQQTSKASAPKIYSSVLQSIGNTPMIRLNRIPQAEGLECEILAKCELFGPGGSHKDRIALRMIEEAEAAGRIAPGTTTIIEPTSGNTGIGVAMVAAVKGYKCILVMPEKMSAEKHETMRALGAEVVRTPKSVLHTEVALALAASTPNSFMLDQYGNAGNPNVHYDTTAEEILAQCEGRIDMIVIGVGTGGVITGVGRKIKERLPNCLVVGVDPEGSTMALPPSINESKSNFWEVEGIGHDWIPNVLDRSVVDKWIKCNDKETFNMARRIIREEGLLVGGSCGSALVGAIKAIREVGGLGPGARVVILLPDSVRNYMSKFLSDGWMRERGFLDEEEEVVGAAYDWWDKELGVALAPLRVPPTLPLNAPLKEALALMKKESLGFLPIVDEGGCVQGVVSYGSLLQAIHPSTAARVSSGEEEQVASHMTTQYKRCRKEDRMGKVYWVLQTAPWALVVEPLEVVRSGKGVVLGERCVGIVTAMDLVELAVC